MFNPVKNLKKRKDIDYFSFTTKSTMPRHVCDSRVKDLRSKRGKAVVTSSKKLKKKDKKIKKKKIQCDYCEMKTFKVDKVLDIMRVWDGVMHLHVFLDVEFEDAN